MKKKFQFIGALTFCFAIGLSVGWYPPDAAAHCDPDSINPKHSVDHCNSNDPPAGDADVVLVSGMTGNLPVEVNQDSSKWLKFATVFENNSEISINFEITEGDNCFFARGDDTEARYVEELNNTVITTTGPSLRRLIGKATRPRADSLWSTKAIRSGRRRESSFTTTFLELQPRPWK